jgi:N-sulfoglucosamine sulfohydrolase
MKWLIILAAAVCLVSPAVSSAAAPATTRPNLVLFIADDLTWNDVGAYGSPDARTPNVDRLARQSLKFELAFAASPT